MDTSQPPTFADVLRYFRLRAGLTQEELAERTGLAWRGISDLERGARTRPRRETLRLLLDALNLNEADRATFLAAARTTTREETGTGDDPYAPPRGEVSYPTPPPIGTVTFLFSDIENSMLLLQRLGERYAALLTEHQRLLRAAFSRHAGYEVDTQGDSFFIAFPTAPDGLAAAVEATRSLAHHRWPKDGEVRVRIGLHTGAPVWVGDRYVGLDVHRAERIATAGYGGQILLSEATVGLVRGDLPEGISLRDLGAHRLKDLQQAERIYQLLMPDLPADFPPLKALDARPHNLPVQPGLLLGREREVAAVATLLRRGDVRLVTITGPGGMGKTRLSLEVAAEVLDAFPSGVWNVRLSRLADPALVVPTIAQVFDLKESGGTPLGQVLRAFLRDKHLMLLLDNFEQVVAATSDIADLLETCPGLKLLVTSRVPLHLREEHEYPLSPLTLPDPAHLPPLERLSQYAAVALFIERAQAAVPDFAVTNASAPAVAEICARLDGLPLAIELAAARVKLLPPPALLKRLEHQLAVLTGGARNLDERQQTMRAAIAWSYDLLSPAEQRLFRRLAVFVGGCTLETVDAVCVAPEGAEPLGVDVLEGLGSLLDHNLIQQRDEGGEPRFGMLYVIREFAVEQLEASGETDAMCRAHTALFLALAEHAEPKLTGSEAGAWLDRLELEHDNLRAALGWARDRGEAERGLRLAAAALRFWIGRGHLREGRAWGEALLALPVERGTGSAAQPVPAGVRAQALWASGILALWQGDETAAGAWLAQAAALGQAAGDPHTSAGALNALGIVAQQHGDLERAAERYVDSLALMREVGDRRGIAVALTNLGEVARYQGDLEQAAAAHEEALALFRHVGDHEHIAVCLANLGAVARRRGEFSRAAALQRDALALDQELGNPRRCAEALEHLAATAGAAGQGAHAARLLGAAASLRETLGAPLPPQERADTEETVAQSREKLGEERWAAAFAAGRELSLEEAITEALAMEDGTASDSPPKASS